MAIAHDSSEPELLAALRRGEARAFDIVYARYRVRIYGFLVRLCGRRDVADDLFQETFLQLARHCKTLNADTALSAFLYTVARNRYRNYRRLSLFRLDRLRQLFAARDEDSVTETPFDSATANATARRLERELGALRPQLREALLLVAVEGLAPEVAAQVLAIEPATLRQRLSRARAELSRRMEANR